MVLHTTYVLRSTIKLWCLCLFFWFWRKIVFGVSYIWYLLYNTDVRLCQFLGSGGKLVLVLHTYVLRVQYNCGVVLVFWSWREIVIDFTYILVYNTVVRLCQFFGCGGK